MREAITLIDDATAVPALDRERFWLALVFNFLIGNCDAHGKNYSLLYYSIAPSLAPLYDLVSTIVFDELTTRLAMSIDGAREIDEVDRKAWARQAEEANVSGRFLRERVGAFVTLVLDATDELAAEPEFEDPIVDPDRRGHRRTRSTLLSRKQGVPAEPTGHGPVRHSGTWR